MPDLRMSPSDDGQHIEVTIPLRRDLAENLGTRDLHNMADWLWTALLAIGHARGDGMDLALSRSTISDATQLIEHTEAVLHHAVRVHKEHGGTQSDLASLADIPAGTASGMRRRATDVTRPYTSWVTGGITRPARNRADLQRALDQALAVGDTEAAAETARFLAALNQVEPDTTT